MCVKLNTTSPESASHFEACQTPQEGGPPVCRWHAERVRAGEGEEASPAVSAGKVYRVRFLYAIAGGDEQAIGWEVNLQEETVTPTDDLAELAYRAVRPRG